MDNVYACAECGHLHFLGNQLGYEECPIEGCNCQGQVNKRPVYFKAMNDPDKEALFMILDRVGQKNVRDWIERYVEAAAYDDPFEYYMREE